MGGMERPRGGGGSYWKMFLCSQMYVGVFYTVISFIMLASPWHIIGAASAMHITVMTN